MDVEERKMMEGNGGMKKCGRQQEVKRDGETMDMEGNGRGLKTKEGWMLKGGEGIMNTRVNGRWGGGGEERRDV